MKPLSYTVQHVVNGNVEDTFTEETSVQVLPDTLVEMKSWKQTGTTEAM